jgi:hypothetical protein
MWWDTTVSEDLVVSIPEERGRMVPRNVGSSLGGIMTQKTTTLKFIYFHYIPKTNSRTSFYSQYIICPSYHQDTG